MSISNYTRKPYKTDTIKDGYHNADILKNNNEETEMEMHVINIKLTK